ncbi:Uma2 family endonuclease [Saccharopolyspora sp. K220]|uniref:Uma2 family endonuclease n=1 Tax=Saccharopolyspora soli TaxID=2926618 RepID=UPI001F5A3892|nr:Uma2 family endonuclease [Saccharopolyspora soli]MCI2420973.1 Uma2 family endonuclease [Saccharopolyspora soli]
MTLVDMRADEQHRPMTVDDLERLPDDGRRYELVDGRLDVSPSPVSLHTLIEAKLSGFFNYVAAPKGYLALPGAGINFNADRTHHRIPDVVVIKAEDFVRPYLVRPPLLAIEVVSESSIWRDYHTKTREYAEFGIPAYWIVNPTMDEPRIVELRLDNGEYHDVQQATGKDIFATTFPFPVTIIPDRLLHADGLWNLSGEEDD